jgi:hypothetical protein
MRSRFIFTVFFLLILSACMEEGKIRVQNNVHNVKLESISWGDVSLYYSLLPGETSEKIVVRDYKSEFPMNHPLEFYMVGAGNRVYLRTKAIYQLDIDDDLLIEITDTTDVINPSLK